jgi:uncharacterized protein YndB with AHSA1/START domain
MSTDTGPDTTPADATSLRLERTYEATAEEVFDAWTSPEVLRRWWVVDLAWRTPVAEVDLRPGGRYRLAMEDPDGGVTHTVGGEYLTVERPELLVYSWCWEGQGDREGHESTVTVRFVGDGERTTVVLEHTGLESPASRDQHRHGWSGCLDSLGARVLTTA